MTVTKLPDAEFEIMRAIWHMKEPVTAPELTERLRRALPEKDWKAQTVGTMLTRLEKKGFLRSEKSAKERHYYSIVAEQVYLCVEQSAFRQRFAGGSFSGLAKALYNENSLSAEDIRELREWLNSIDVQ